MDWMPQSPEGWGLATLIVTGMLTMLKRSSPRQIVSGCWDACLALLAWLVSVKEVAMLRAYLEYERTQTAHWREQAEEAQQETHRLGSELRAVRDALGRCRDVCSGG
jgi:hypothetical protein